MGPGLHNKAGDPFSLTCEPIVDENDKPIEGKIYGKVKGGYTVDIDGVITFLPGSQVDVKPVKDINHLIEQELTF